MNIVAFEQCEFQTPRVEEGIKLLAEDGSEHKIYPSWGRGYWRRAKAEAEKLGLNGSCFDENIRITNS